MSTARTVAATVATAETTGTGAAGTLPAAAVIPGATTARLPAGPTTAVVAPAVVTMAADGNPAH